jgi:glycosyltransferase involved in cell wall biosynthesis
MADFKILQLAHGKIKPDYISAYAIRVNNLLDKNSWKICSVAGLILHDEKDNNVIEYRSILTTVYSLLKGNRFLEIAISKGIFLRKKYINDVKSLISQADIVIFEGPWQYNLFQSYLKGKFVVYDAHNVESLLRLGNKYHDYTVDLEKRLVQESQLLISVSQSDMKYFNEKFNCKNSCLVTHILENKTYEWKGEESNHIIFIGSIYQPNVEAVEFIISMAVEFPDFQFDIVGNINKHGFAHTPKNVVFHGLVNDQEKNQLLQNSCIALNPIFSGGGRNVKMVDYIMHGVPVISTELGIRGFENYNLSGSIIIAQSKSFKDAIKKVTENRELLKAMGKNMVKLRDEILKAEGNQNAYSLIKSEYKKWKINNN